MRRGEIWWVSLGAPRGSEPGRRRPVLIVSADAFNRSALRTAIVATITSNERLAVAPGNVRLAKRDSGLSKVSVVDVSQLLTLDRRYFTQKIKRLPERCLHDVDAGLRLSLGLRAESQ